MRVVSLAALLAASCIILSLYYPVILVEVQYWFHHPGHSSAQIEASSGSAVVSNLVERLQPVDSNFAVIIPKIGANSRVIADVDPFNKRSYQAALKLGVAHVRNSPLPGQVGNSFIFSHSSATLWESRQYNAVFYLLDKLELGDEIYVVFNSKAYQYVVRAKKIVDPGEVRYLDLPSVGPTLTLMTCWPAGTTLRRLLVTSEMVFDTPPIR